MLDSMPVTLLVGTVLGFLAGIGIGGGSLLILWLTFVLGMDHSMARGINLLFFLPSALISCAFRWKQGCIQIKTLLPAILSGCIAAGVSAWISVAIDISLLKKLFGGLLLITGIRELLYKPRKKEQS